MGKYNQISIAELELFYRFSVFWNTECKQNAVFLHSIMATIPLFLSDIAGSEILLILVFILVFFGSKSIPGIARTMGRTIRQIKDASQEMQNEIIKSGGDLKADFDLQRIVNDTKSDIEKPFL